MTDGLERPSRDNRQETRRSTTMTVRYLDPDKLGHNEDWEGNNAAFHCPVCSKLFAVSDLLHSTTDRVMGERECPDCGKSVARVVGGRKSGGSASITWEQDA